MHNDNGGKGHLRIAEDAIHRDEMRAFSRRDSTLSIHSDHGRVVVAPGNLLPITYRSLSFQVDDAEAAGKTRGSKQENEHLRSLAELDWHLISVQDVQHRLGSSSNGLQAYQASQRLVQHGRNQLSPPSSPWLRIILGYIFGGFGSILIGGAVLVFVAWKPLGDPPAKANLALAIVLVAVWAIQAAFNAWQDWSSSRVMASITTMLPDQCIAMRDGMATSFSALDLVPGDVVQVKQGNKLPADMRFIQVSADAKFDRSILTGESEPVPGTVESTHFNYLETNNIGLQGSYCMSGACLGMVVATGNGTVFGRVASLSSGRRTKMTPMQREIFRFVLIIASLVVVFVTIIIVVWAAYLRQDHPDFINVPALIVSCVSVGVAFIPEGLPISISMGLTIAAGIMKKNKILCKSLATVETLGAVSVICSDKTGTLTKGEMFVTDCLVGSGEECTTENLLRMPISDSVHLLRTVAGICNAAEIDASTMDRPLHAVRFFGDPTDQAILRLSQSLGPVSDLRAQWKTAFEIPFNSKNKFMIRVVRSSLGGETEGGYLLIKGAPDILLPRVTGDINGRDLSHGDRGKIEAVKDRWSGLGKRVILLAQKAVSDEWIRDVQTSHNDKAVLQSALNGLTLVGLVALIDPPRDEIPGVINTLRKASIRIMMVTGDYKLTAQAIAIQCGIITAPPSLIDDISRLDHDQTGKDKTYLPGTTSAIVLSGPELADLSTTDWDRLCTYDEIVFARTTPEQKLRIVQEFQARDHIVAMTGDGVNDAPSLRAADVGVALGSGSDIAIEAADIVLLDSFSAIVEAVRYGRLVYDNLKKTVIYLLPAGSFSELWPVITNVVLGVPQILSSFLMIIICCLTDCAGAIALAWEQPESDLLLRPPRDPKRDHLVDKRLLGHAYFFIGLYECFLSYVMAFWYMQRNGIPFSALVLHYGTLDAPYNAAQVSRVANAASSIYFVNLVIMQFFNLLAVRTRRLSIFQQPPVGNAATQNLFLFVAMAFALGIVFLFLYVPDLHDSLGTTTVPVEHFFLPVAFGLGLLLLDEGRKVALRRWPGGVVARVAW
ncbi:hypothetical protein BDV06DRAFT_200244 [Aspergillus oleicola]